MGLGEAEINLDGQRGSFVSPRGGKLSEATMPWEVLGATVPKGPQSQSIPVQRVRSTSTSGEGQALAEENGKMGWWAPLLEAPVCPHQLPRGGQHR